MKLAYFPNQIARNGIPVLGAFITGARKHGIRAVTDDFDADAAVIWSVLWKGRMAQNKSIYQHYRGIGRPVIVIDAGVLCRDQTWKIALNHVNADGYYGHLENLDHDRPKKLNIVLEKKSVVNPAIMLAAQHTSSLQVQDLDLVGWLDDKIKSIRKISDRPIILRPHPRCRMDLQRFLRHSIEVQKPTPVPGTYDGFDFNSNYHAIVNYNSGPGIRAAIEGARPLVDKSSLAAPVSITMSDIEKPYNVDRSQWLIEICHTEYTLEEIEQGHWIERLHLS